MDKVSERLDGQRTHRDEFRIAGRQAKRGKQLSFTSERNVLPLEKTGELLGGPA